MKTAKIVILAGQSNADGISHPEYLDIHFGEEKAKEYKQGFNKIKINYYSHTKKSNGFISVKADKADEGIKTFGPEVGMAEALSQRENAEEYFIVKCALGCTSLHYDWNSPLSGDDYDKDGMNGALKEIFGKTLPKGWIYDELINVVKESIDLLKNMGYAPKIHAFCWMQGEADSRLPEHAIPYIKRYQNLLLDFKSVFKEYLQDCVYVDAGVALLRECSNIVNDSKREFAQNHSGCCYIDTNASGLTTLKEPYETPDIDHYDSESMIKLGKMFAENIL